jgi:hypothetical protein
LLSAAKQLRFQATPPPPPLHAATPVPSKGRTASISRATRCTVPVPTPHSEQPPTCPCRPAIGSGFVFRGGAPLRPPEAFALLHGSLKPGADSLADHAALKLGKGARNLKHQPPGWRGRIDGLLLEIRAEKVDERASTPVDRPNHDHVKTTPLAVLQHPVQSGPRIPHRADRFSAISG